MFNKPIVTTNYDSVNVQFTDGQNGLIVDISAEGIANGIMRMINDKALRDQCVEHLRHEKIENPEEVEKLYDLIERT